MKYESRGQIDADPLRIDHRRRTLGSQLGHQHFEAMRAAERVLVQGQRQQLQEVESSRWQLLGSRKVQ